jgi:hypothetical protein
LRGVKVSKGCGRWASAFGTEGSRMDKAEASAGYVEIRDRFFRFRRARCVWSGRELEIRARGPKARLVLAGILLGEAAGPADLAGRAWQPSEADLASQADALAESGLHGRGWGFAFVPESLRVECRWYNPAAGALAIRFAARVVDDRGAEYEASGDVVATVVPESAFYPEEPGA